jgi:GlcNAc-P-P-Und epimerase
LRVLITGGSGFIGTNLIEHYLQAGADVVNYDCAPPRNPAHTSQWSSGDLRDREATRRVVQQARPELVLHMGARTDLQGRSLDDYAANTDGVRNLLDALAEVPAPRRVLFCSSMLVCRLGYQPAHDLDFCPDTLYGESKMRGERLVREAGELGYSWAIVRPTSIWGPWFGVPYRSFFDAVRAGLYVQPRNLRVPRSYGFVLNAVAQLAAIAQAPAAAVQGGLFYLADYEPTEVKSWADLISATSGVRPARQVPLALLRLAARSGDVLQALGMKQPPLTSTRLRNLLTPAVYDLSRTRALCPELPYSLEEGVRLTVSWLDRASSPPAA